MTKTISLGNIDKKIEFKLIIIPIDKKRDYYTIIGTYQKKTELPMIVEFDKLKFFHYPALGKIIKYPKYNTLMKDIESLEELGLIIPQKQLAKIILLFL